ncbi:tannase/feruloyl esterase family alpha/beta hydrolase [Streptomyces caniscabiei]|uniref:tannase/feruloyl esterase family alpha/beta hydrolase n=1 Tax=Streptomyces caniscabiei TaxID=2746961 RepID=UPI0007C72EEE|nr:tannase/feruloyl esterase family alpha/beta hydrolase [Streptomyces caniscabiei]
MSSSSRVEVKGLAQWVTVDKPVTIPDVAGRCTVEFVQDALAHIDGATVAAVTVNTSGECATSQAAFIPGVDPVIRGLPEYCEVRVEHRTPGDHVAHVTVWLPLEWNERFLATGGGGSRTSTGIFEIPWARNMTLPTALRNGFATAMTDAANRDPRIFDWAIDEKTGELDWELMRNWSYRGTHDMTVIAKAVVEAVYGLPARYSYYQGASGGGRQGLAAAQRHPEDYDGIWAAEPAINWTRFIPAEIWPALVMKEHGNALPPAKLRAFRAAAVEACDGPHGLKYADIAPFGTREFDPARVVGTATEAGEITAADAEVVRKIWDGPRTSTGEQLWYGLLPSTESWADGPVPVGLAATQEIDGEVTPIPFMVAEPWFKWLLRDPAWDWRTLTFQQFEELFAQSVREFAEFATDDPDLTGVRDSGGKVIITHGANDEVIFPEGSVDYYRRVQEAMGGEAEASDFVRLFISSGDTHGFSYFGPGPHLAAGMAALMEWVEEGKAPEVLMAETYDPEAGKATMTRPVYPYPLVAQHDGEGDPADAASYRPRRVS